jgi:hypothetical protein
MDMPFRAPYGLENMLRYLARGSGTERREQILARVSLQISLYEPSAPSR